MILLFDLARSLGLHDWDARDGILYFFVQNFFTSTPTGRIKTRIFYGQAVSSMCSETDFTQEKVNF